MVWSVSSPALEMQADEVEAYLLVQYARKSHLACGLLKQARKLDMLAPPGGWAGACMHGVQCTAANCGAAAALAAAPPACQIHSPALLFFGSIATVLSNDIPFLRLPLAPLPLPWQVASALPAWPRTSTRCCRTSLNRMMWQLMMACCWWAATAWSAWFAKRSMCVGFGDCRKAWQV